jgi:hypothetical protein
MWMKEYIKKRILRSRVHLQEQIIIQTEIPAFLAYASASVIYHSNFYLVLSSIYIRRVKFPFPIMVEVTWFSFS